MDTIWAATRDFQQSGILTSVNSDKPVRPPFKRRNSKCCLVSSIIFIEYSSDKQRLWSDCAHTTLLEISCRGSIIIFSPLLNHMHLEESYGISHCIRDTACFLVSKFNPNIGDPYSVKTLGPRGCKFFPLNLFILMYYPIDIDIIIMG